MTGLAAQYIMKDVYHLQPAAATAILSIPNLAWSPKIVYGMIVD